MPISIDYFPTAGIVLNDGDLSSNSVKNKDDVRPALNLNSSKILFTSAAVGGKPSDATTGELTENTNYAAIKNNDGYKLTLLDESRSGFSAYLKSVSSNTATISYSGAKTGVNEYISVIIKNGTDVKYYGRVAALSDASATSGDVNITLPDDYSTANGDVLCVFNEQYNGDKNTDYASDVVVLPDYRWYTNDTSAIEFTISTVSEFLGFANLVNGTNLPYGVYGFGEVQQGDVKLTNDLDLSCISNWTPIGHFGMAFQGYFDGDGHKITGLTVNYSAEQYDYVGLFGFIYGGGVKNLSVSGNVTAPGNNSYVGGIVGYITGAPGPTKIENCSFAGTVKGNGICAGGIVGFASGATILKCRNTATVSGSANHIGGIGGKSGYQIIGYCCNHGDITSDFNNAYVGGIVGYASSAYLDDNIHSCYSTGTISATGTNAKVGGSVGYAKTDEYDLNIDGVYYLDSTAAKGIGDIETNEGRVNGNAEGKSAASLANGEVAWLLQNAADEAEGQIWGQRIGTDAYPVFANESGSNTVCKVTFKVDGKDDQVKYVNKSGTVSIDTPTAPTGHSFDGWYTAATGGTKFDLSSAITADTTLYARFTPNTYTVSYNAGANGTGTVAAGSKTHGVDFTLSSDTFTRTGYTQTGWATSDGGEKVYDLGGSYTANTPITLYPVWTDITAPVVSGITNGKTYCSAQTVTVSDNDGISSVTVNEKPVTLDTNGNFTLSPAEDKQKIVATDKAGNKTEMTVTVNDGHTYEWQDENGRYWQKCNFCEHETAKKDIPEIVINGADKVCRTQDYTFTFTLPEGVTEPKAAYYPAESDHPLVVTENDGVYTATVSRTEYEDDYNISKFFVKVYAETEDGFEFLVRKEVLFSQEHTGGTADCTHKAKCEVCGEEYGEVDESYHVTLKHTEAKAATTEAEGNIEYWYCEECNKYFSDKDGKNEITLADTVIAKLTKTESPKTGDNSRMALWFALALLSAGVLFGAIVYRRKHSAK